MPALFFRFCLITFLARVAYQMARSPVLPRFAEHLGAAPALIGLIVGASTLTGVACKFPAGLFSDRVGRRRMLLIGAAFFAGPPFLYPLLHHPEPLLAVRFLHGFATAIFMPVANAFIADLFTVSRAERIGWFSLLAESGAMLGPLLGGWLLFRTESYTLVYVASGVLGLLAFGLMAQLYAQEGKEAKEGKEGKEGQEPVWPIIRETLRHRTIVVTSAMEACLFLGIGAFVGFVPIYAAQYGINAAQVGVVLAVQLVVSMLSKPVTGRLSDRLGRKPMIQLGLVLCAVALPWTGLVTTCGGLLAISAALGLARAMVTPSTTALVADEASRIGHGAGMGILGTIYDVGDASGPILAGILIASLGYLPCFSIIAGVMAAGLLLFSVLVREPR